ncbi:hypothetical protein FKM82_000414 [Ascaphus truei]
MTSNTIQLYTSFTLLPLFTSTQSFALYSSTCSLYIFTPKPSVLFSYFLLSSHSLCSHQLHLLLTSHPHHPPKKQQLPVLFSLPFLTITPTMWQHVP